MRLLAAQRAERLEQELSDAAKVGTRAEVARTLTARHRLLALKKAAAVRTSGAAAMGLVIGAALAALTLIAADFSGSAERSAQASVLRGAPGDRLNLTLSYSVSAPAAR